ncbi:MAG: hypothetical protein KIT34_06030 [Cyanobacteria bacterium TGS_CYA1]|nr:hypothetical protein [Cyanobacteria bacterium TGS_CYA1]
MNNNLNIDIFGWLCIFIAGLGLIFPFSVIGAANLIFISLGITYICYFVWREAWIQADPPKLKEARKNWLYANKSREIEEKKFQHKSDAKCYIVTSANGITFNASNRELIIAWSEVIEIRSVRILGQDLHTVYTLKAKYNFDQTYNDHLELAEMIKKQI